MVCQICQSTIFSFVVGQGREGSPFSTHHKTFASFKRSVDDGCYVCSRYWASIGSEEQEMVLQFCKEESEGRTPSWPAQPSSPWGLDGFDAENEDVDDEDADDEGAHDECATTFTLKISGNEGPPPYDSYYLHVSHSNGLDGYGFNMSCSEGSLVFQSCKVVTTTKSSETFSLAKSWISQCDEAHKSCRSATATESWYPTRLIDCGFTTKAESCQLVESNGNATSGHYMTFSHCWGKAKCLILTTENYNQLLNDIPMACLPVLYRDAVYAVRQLGIRYLWIDSLCIIQEGDNGKDWQNEVTKMSEVYSNSFCNISAAAALDGECSMFNVRNTATISPETITYANGINQDVSIYLITDPWFWTNEVTNAHINTRAWVLQERLLSVRTLHFGELQLAWECRENIASETFPICIPPAIDAYPSIKSTFALIKTDSEKSVNKQTLSQAWYDIVLAYTVCHLTFPNDKLVAISAIAKKMRYLMQDQYIAGLWRRNLEHQLLWHVQGAIESPLGTYRAPSWSWTSVEGAISCGDIDKSLDMQIQVEDLEIQHMTDDDTGNIKNAWLSLRGHLRPIHLQKKSFHDRRVLGVTKGILKGINGSLFLDTEPTDGASGFDTDNAKGTIYCMAASSSIYERLEVLCLRVIDREKGIFRRIGLWSGWDQQERLVLNGFLTYEEGEEKYPCEQYRDGYHYIRII